MANDSLQKEIFDVVGDARDPSGIDPSARGVAPGHDFAKFAGKPMIWFELGTTRMPMTWDVFPGAPGEPAWIQALCGQCVASNPAGDVGLYGLTIRQDQKPFEYDAGAEVPPFPGWTRSEMRAIARKGLPPGAGGRLTIGAPIECSRCGWHVRIVDNVVRPP